MALDNQSDVGTVGDAPAQGPATLDGRLRQVFAQALETGDGVDVADLHYRDIPAWDSLGHMSLVAAIEDEFGVQLDTQQVIDLSSYRVAYDMLRGMGAS